MKKRAQTNNSDRTYNNPEVGNRMHIIPDVSNKISLVHKYIIAVFKTFYYPPKKVFYNCPEAYFSASFIILSSRPAALAES